MILVVGYTQNILNDELFHGNEHVYFVMESHGEYFQIERPVVYCLDPNKGRSIPQ